jgi:hypothetical protein
LIVLRDCLKNVRKAFERKEIPQLPPVKFGEPWVIPGFYRTTDVKSVFLRYKVANTGHDVGLRIGKTNPFDKYKNFLKEPTP